MNEYEIKDIAATAGSDLVNASMMGDGLGGYDLGNDMFGGIDSPSADYVSDAMSSGNTSSLKLALGAAIEVISEEDLTPGLPPGTTADVCGYIANGAVETTRTLCLVAAGEITMAESEAALQNTTVATVAAITTKIGHEIGQQIGSVFGTSGKVIGGMIGTTVGHLMGATVGETVYQGAKKLTMYVSAKVKEYLPQVMNTVKNTGKKIMSFFGI